MIVFCNDMNKKECFSIKFLIGFEGGKGLLRDFERYFNKDDSGNNFGC